MLYMNRFPKFYKQQKINFAPVTQRLSVSLFFVFFFYHLFPKSKEYTEDKRFIHDKKYRACMQGMPHYVT